MKNIEFKKNMEKYLLLPIETLFIFMVKVLLLTLLVVFIGSVALLPMALTQADTYREIILWVTTISFSSIFTYAIIKTAK